jgi:hypothetical protein
MKLTRVLGYPLAFLPAFCLATGCATRAGMPPARSASDQEQADSGLSVPPPSTKKGIIVPSDVGVASHPGTTATAGTNDNSLGSPIGTGH